MSDKPVSEMSFEEAMAELERVVGQLDSGDVALKESIELYEHGALLKERCAKTLRDAEERVERITQNERGEATGTAPLDEASGGAGQKNAQSDADDEIPF